MTPDRGPCGLILDILALQRPHDRRAVGAEGSLDNPLLDQVRAIGT